VLESTQPDTIQLRTTASGEFMVYGIVYPASCTGSGLGGASSMVSSHRFSLATGDTLAGTLCSEGSTMLVTVYRLGGEIADQFRCMRLAGNANVCQKVF
jgi:hypothetical protein